MAKEDDLKRIELRVSVNCCEGCNRKVLKALSIKGVLRVEIHSDESRVAVIGNVDGKILIKRLSKVGKGAEITISPEATQKPKCKEEEEEMKKKKPDEPNEKERDKEENKNKSSSAETESKNSGNGDERKKEGKEISAKSTAYEALMSKSSNPAMELMASQARAGQPTEPIAFPIPCYAISAYPAPSPCCFSGHHCYEMPLRQPPASATFGSYYDGNESVGCGIM
ncbi:hypothetical protein Cni_G20254 [Canna indica]|uniref:HMA domain-containing protein n=1 Tax=Canna indica TaxID=4628 RepID=A0AAQ3QJC8_9LILI|nr:hypothetical protein Cni_G20254 [Canna indica]